MYGKDYRRSKNWESSIFFLLFWRSVVELELFPDEHPASLVFRIPVVRIMSGRGVEVLQLVELVVGQEVRVVHRNRHRVRNFAAFFGFRFCRVRFKTFRTSSF